jgi:hypothetical protein
MFINPPGDSDHNPSRDQDECDSSLQHYYSHTDVFLYSTQSPNIYPRARVKITRALINSQKVLPEATELKAAPQTVKEIALDTHDRQPFCKQVFETALIIVTKKTLQADRQMDILG